MRTLACALLAIGLVLGFMSVAEAGSCPTPVVTGVFPQFGIMSALGSLRSVSTFVTEIGDDRGYLYNVEVGFSSIALLEWARTQAPGRVVAITIDFCNNQGPRGLYNVYPARIFFLR